MRPLTPSFSIRPRWALLLCWLGLLAASLQAFAQPARFDRGLLIIPVVEDGRDLWLFELELLDDAFPPAFDLVWSERATARPGSNTAYFIGNTLVIPEVMVEGRSWWVELLEDHANHFILDNYGRNPDFNTHGIAAFLDDWQRMPGIGADIGVGADGSVWALGGIVYDDYFDFSFDDDGIDYDFGLYTWDGFGWLEVPGSGIHLDVDPRGYPWVVNSDDQIWRLGPYGWERIPGRARDIGIGADGSVWVLGTTERRGGYEVFRYTGYGWQKVGGTGVRIDVDPDGRPWVINHDDEIFRLENGYWRRMPGYAKDIGIGADGSVWVIGANDREGGYGIYRWNGHGWTRVPGSARQISVGPDGRPWVVNRDGEIYVGI